MNSAGDLLSFYLDFHGISQHQLERKTGISQASISKILKKEVFTSVKTAKIIEKHTSLSARILLLADVEYRLENFKMKRYVVNIPNDGSSKEKWLLKIFDTVIEDEFIVPPMIDENFYLTEDEIKSFDKSNGTDYWKHAKEVKEN